MTNHLLEVTVPVAPLRADPSDRSEMVSQLIAGERCRLLQRGEKDWVQVELMMDSYRGWCDMKQLTVCSPQDEAVQSRHAVLTQAPISLWSLEGGAQCVLPASARLTCDLEGAWRLGAERLEPLNSLDACLAPCALPLDAAMNFLGAPYLWGGKTIMGIDCSGLIQVAFALCGVRMPRDASAQVHTGNPIDWSNRASGDLAFFANEEGAVIHVGILTKELSILHAAGQVRIDDLDARGIRKDEDYTHQFHSLRRVNDSARSQVEQ